MICTNTHADHVRHRYCILNVFNITSLVAMHNSSYNKFHFITMSELHILHFPHVLLLLRYSEHGQFRGTLSELRASIQYNSN